MDDINGSPPKKKRGRKPLPKKEEPKEKTYKKRGRKPKNLEEPTVDTTQLVQNNEQVILHLPINSLGNSDNPTPYEEPRNNFLKIDEFNNEILGEDSQSQSKSQNVDKLFININSITEESTPENSGTLNDIIEEIREQRQQEISYTNNTNDKYSFVFMDYIETNKTNSWPSKSKIDCLWCCHSFDTEPIGIPTRKDGDTFTMFGNFCCAECAAAYNFDSRLSGDEMWERYSLLNMIYSGNGHEIKMALPRLSLKKFGGPFSIGEFRRHNPSKNFKITMPPTVAIIPTLEEITIDSDNSLFNGISTDFINKTSNELRLKRTKPLPNHRNTLENCMNLKYI